MAVKVREVDGVWRIVVDWKGQRMSRNVGAGKEGRRAARVAAEQIQAKLAQGDLSVLAPPAPVAPPAPPPTFADVAEDWRRHYPSLRNVRVNTMANYESSLRHHLLPHFGRMPVKDITAAHVEVFITTKLAKGGSARFPGRPLSRGSLQIALKVLRLILQRAVREKLLDANPMADLDRFSGKTHDDDQIDPFTTAELQAIIRAAQKDRDPDLAPLIRVWAATGLRAGEVCGLQWQDLDLDAGTGLVRRTWSRGRLGPTKTGQHRTVSLLHPIGVETPEWRPGAEPETWGVVDGLRRLRVRALMPDGFVFGGGQQPIPSFRLHASWRRVIRAAKVRYRAPEQLRHTFASTLLSRNAPLLYVQRQGGWKSAAVLLRVYSSWLPESVPPTVVPAPVAVGASSP